MHTLWLTWLDLIYLSFKGVNPYGHYIREDFQVTWRAESGSSFRRAKGEAIGNWMGSNHIYETI